MGKFYNPVTSTRTSFLIFFLLFGVAAFGQNLNINENGIKNLPEVSENKLNEDSFFKNTLRARPFKLNSGLKSANSFSKGQRIDLELFLDKRFSSIVQKKTTDINGVTTVVLKLEEFNFAFGYLSLSKNTTSLHISVPEKNEFYSTRYNENKLNYLLQLDPLELKENSGCDILNKSNKKKSGSSSKLFQEPLENHETNFFNSSSPLNNYCANPDGENATVNIDIMVVYSDEAKTWADGNGGIETSISTALARANTVFANSELGINLNLVYSGPANYSDSSGNSLEHLEALTFDNDGVMDDLHDVRKNTGAVMVAIFTRNANVGGMAYGLKDKFGDASSPFSLTSIYSAVNSETFAHELGHNLGAMHSKYQSVQPGPYEWDNWPENTWSNGWRWQGEDGVMYCTVMTYYGGNFYDDGISALEIPYFSNPHKIYQGSSMGDIKDGDNFRTLNYTKFLVATYSTNLKYCMASGSNKYIASLSRVELGQIDNASDAADYSDFSILTSCVYPDEEKTFKISTDGSGDSKELSIWVDWNNDLSFDENNELVFQSNENLSEYSGSFLVPTSVETGIKRVRIRVQDFSSGSELGPCGIADYGEVEDYSINVLAPGDCTVVETPMNLSVDNVQSNSIIVTWDNVEGINEYNLRYRPSGTNTWNTIEEIFSDSFKIAEISPSTEYEIQVASKCGTNSSEFSSSILATTKPALSQLVFNDPIQNSDPSRTLAPVTVKILDVNGDLSNSSAKVSLRLLDVNLNEVILNGSKFQNALDGIAIFDNLSIDNIGNYVLEASIDGLPVVRSNIFEIALTESQSFLVNTLDDTPDEDIFDKVCADINGNCSLRAAIENANSTNMPDEILFNIPGEGPFTIMLEKSLPVIKFPLNIDGTSQPGYSFETPQIVISGENISSNAGNSHAFKLEGINSSNSSIVGFVIGRFGVLNNQNGFGIYIRYSDNNKIQANYLGVGPDGESSFDNVFGIVITGKHNLIGGLEPNQRNIISGNSRNGVELGSTSSDNLIQGNYIGTNVTGTTQVANYVGLTGRGKNTYDGNLISGNSIGLYILDDGSLVINNKIGTDYSGDQAIPNHDGIQVTGNNNRIGIPGEGNLISGSLGTGVYITGENNEFNSNIIGLNSSGNVAIPNGYGISVNGNNNRIGSSQLDSGNFIGGNSRYGISVGGSFNKIQNNRVGINGNGNSIPNGEVGIRITGQENLVGGLNGEDGNIIANNPSGIAILTNNAIRNKISWNKMFNNTFGIDLNSDRQTRNDRGDSDSGPNNLQNHPEISESSYDGNLMEIKFILDSEPDYSSYPIELEFYLSDGNSQGQTYIGSFIVDEFISLKGKNKRTALVNIIPGIELINGDLIVATATDSEGNTSEFSDEVSLTVTGSCTPQTWYADIDADGFGNPANTLESCSAPEGYVSNANDCDDTDPKIGELKTWYLDNDGDGYGNPEILQEACTLPPGYVIDNKDCVDTDNTIFPGAIDDTVDGKDQNCDGTDGPVTSCIGSDNLLVSEICSTNTYVTWEITNTGSCKVEGRWELRKNSSTGDSAGTFILTAGGTIQFNSGVVDKGKTQIVVYWPNNDGLEVSTSLNASGIECTGVATMTMDQDLIVAPNPISEEGIGLYFTPIENKSVISVSVYNSGGNLMISESFEIMAGTDHLVFAVDHSYWVEGVYILNVILNNKTYQVQFIK